MRWIDILALSGKNFLRRKARSILTILGVVIGTMSVVIMLSIGEGLNVGFEKQVSQWGSLTEITVNKNYDPNASGSILDDNTVEEFKAIENISAVTPMKQDFVTFVRGREITGVQVMGIDVSQMSELGYDLYSGRLLEAGDTTQILMGYNVPFNFYNPRARGNQEQKSPYDEQGKPNPLPFDPMSETIKMTFDQSYGQVGPTSTGKKPKLLNIEVVGVMSSASQQRAYIIIMDINTMVKLRKDYDKTQQQSSGGSSGTPIDGGNDNSVRYDKTMGVGMSSGGSSGQNESKYDTIIVKVDNMKNVEKAQAVIKEAGYQCYSSMESLNQMKEQARLIQLVLGGIGAISFLVAALGITNTMVMSTYERTREIGIMKVMGCKLTNIRDLFLCEAGIIGFLGGAIGIIFSFLVSILINKLAGGSGLLGGGFGGQQMDISIIPFWLVFAGMGFTTFIGLVSGLYPAVRAVKLSVLEAIKNE